MKVLLSTDKVQSKLAWRKLAKLMKESMKINFPF
jgi:alkyl hydroperoxide reductase subunit AhpC